MDHDKFKLSHTVYVVGLAQVGGCWSPLGQAYKRFEDAMAEVEADRARPGQSLVKVFSFEVYEPK